MSGGNNKQFAPKIWHGSFLTRVKTSELVKKGEHITLVYNYARVLVLNA